MKKDNIYICIILFLCIIIGYSLPDCIRYNYQMKDYQLIVHKDTIFVYDKGKLVDVFLQNENTFHDKK